MSHKRRLSIEKCGIQDSLPRGRLEILHLRDLVLDPAKRRTGENSRLIKIHVGHLEPCAVAACCTVHTIHSPSPPSISHWKLAGRESTFKTACAPRPPSPIHHLSPSRPWLSTLLSSLLTPSLFFSRHRPLFTPFPHLLGHSLIHLTLMHTIPSPLSFDNTNTTPVDSRLE